MRFGLTSLLHIAAGVILLSGAASLLVGCALSPDGKTGLTAIPLKDDVRVEPQLDADPPIAQVFSESGIGGAELHFFGGGAPQRFTLRLHLTGLEALTLNCDGNEVRASVLSYGDGSVQQWMIGQDGGAETPIDPGDSHWAHIAPVYGEQNGADSRRAPGTPTYFDVELPEAFAVAGCRLLRVSWVDFYR